MFSRVARYVPASAQGACKAQLPGAIIMASQQTRGMATAQQLKGRIKTVTNIGKITKAMKMVAAAKLRSVQSKLENARAFQESAAGSFTDRGDYEGAKKHLIVPLTSDRGLCGAINSSVFKAVRTMINDSVAKGREVTILATGEKGKAAMDRLYRKHFTEMLSEFGKFHPVTFSECCVLAEYILSQEFDYATIIYNRFKSAISYATTPVEFASLKHFKGEKEFWDKFDFEGEPRELLEDYHQFRLAVRLYHFFAENATSEQSARMTAMENSSRNAGDMLERLRLIYNRTRQAKITTELSEIISGASSLQG